MMNNLYSEKSLRISKPHVNVICIFNEQTGGEQHSKTTILIGNDLTRLTHTQ